MTSKHLQITIKHYPNFKTSGKISKLKVLANYKNLIILKNMQKLI